MAQLVRGPSPRRYPARITADMLFQLRICRSTRLPVDFGVRTRRVPRQKLGHLQYGLLVHRHRMHRYVQPFCPRRQRPYADER